MAQTAADRQRAYRQRQERERYASRINTWISPEAGAALGRLSSCYGVTKREMLERLITEADQSIIDACDDNELEDYLGG